MDKLFSDILLSYKQQPRDVMTKPLRGEGRWFFVSEQNGNLYISASKKSPSSRLSDRRRLNEKEFEEILDLYKLRKTAMYSSYAATKCSMNSSYWFGIFADMRY